SIGLCFFFSSRRRHTSFSRDWSSDVCSSDLPFFLFALPAGAIGDIVDRRKLILYTESWMVAFALVLAVATIAGLMSPTLLLGLTDRKSVVEGERGDLGGGRCSTIDMRRTGS